MSHRSGLGGRPIASALERQMARALICSALGCAVLVPSAWAQLTGTATPVAHAAAQATAQAAASGATQVPAQQSATQPASQAPLRSVRARDLGVPFEGQPGPFNAITDVAGVEVGFSTLVRGGRGRSEPGPQVRTGVTAILPRGRLGTAPVFAGFTSQNGNGEMTGVHWVRESGFLEGPIMITNTHSVGVVRDAVVAWQVQHGFVPVTSAEDGVWWSMPVVAETYDGPPLNDINGFHVRPENAFAAIDTARSGPVAEGNVGGGTAMQCYEFKGGTGTASRRVSTEAGTYTVGVLVQCNCGTRHQLLVAGTPVGREIPMAAVQHSRGGPGAPSKDVGSIIIVVATDAPLLPGQLERLTRRATMGLARTGSVSGNGSGDLFVAFSTANAQATAQPVATVSVFSNSLIDPLFEATAQATEEAIVNAMVGARSMEGSDGSRVEALPHTRLKEVLAKYRRLGN